MNNQTIGIIPYRAEYGLETIKMIRAAFQTAMSLERDNSLKRLGGHLDFFSKYNPDHVHVAMDAQTSTIVGCMVLMDSEVEQLYVHIDCQRKGIGSQFIDSAKQQSPGLLELFAFQQNTQAQAFYKKHGFVEKARGTAPRDGNSWATSTEQLADIRFQWQPA